MVTHYEANFPCKEQESYAKECENFIELVASELIISGNPRLDYLLPVMTLILHGNETSSFSSLQGKFRISSMDTYSFDSIKYTSINLMNDHLLIAAESTIILYNIETQEIQPSPLQVNLFDSSAWKSKCYGVIEDPRSKNISLQQYEIEKIRWNHVADLPYQVKFSTMAVTDEYIFVIGGVTEDAQPINLIQCYSLKFKDWIRPLTMTKEHANCTAAIGQSTLYIADRHTHLIDVVPFSDTVTMSVRIPEIPSVFTSCFQLLTIYEQLLCIGDNCSSIYILYPSTTVGPTWQPLIDMPSKLTNVKTCAMGDKSVLIMGTYTEGESGIKQTRLYTLTWKC